MNIVFVVVEQNYQHAGECLLLLPAKTNTAQPKAWQNGKQNLSIALIAEAYSQGTATQDIVISNAVRSTQTK
jgi:hypothetical protein